LTPARPPRYYEAMKRPAHHSGLVMRRVGRRSPSMPGLSTRTLSA